jgi:hypothetical protein
MYCDETIELMEQMLPARSRSVSVKRIEDLIFTLIQPASELNALLKPGILISDTPKLGCPCG